MLRRAAELDGGFSLAVEELPWGSAYYPEHGAMAPAGYVEPLRRYDAIYLGAVGSPSVPDHVTLWGLLLPIRQVLDQYVNLRPVKLIEGVDSPLRGRAPADIDMMCVRENTEGEYCGAGGRVHQGPAVGGRRCRPTCSRVSASSGSPGMRSSSRATDAAA